MLRLLSPREQVDVPSRHRVGDVQRHRGHMNSTKSLAFSWSLILASQMSGQQSANQQRSGPCLLGWEISYLLQTFPTPAAALAVAL